MENSKKKKILIGISLVLLVIILVVGGYYFYKEYNNPNDNNANNNEEKYEPMPVAMEKEDTTNYQNTMSFRVCHYDSGDEYRFYNPNNNGYEEYPLYISSEIVDIKIEGSANSIVFYNDTVIDDESSYNGILFRYLLYKDNNKIKVYDGETKESYILNVPVGNKYNYYYVWREEDGHSDISFALFFSDEDAFTILRHNDVRHIDEFDEDTSNIKPFGLLAVKTNKVFMNVYNIDYGKGYVLYYDNNEMQVYDINSNTSKKVNIPTSIGTHNLGKCKGDYKNYINCEYSFVRGTKTSYRSSYYSYKLDKVMYTDKYDYFKPLSDEYVLGVIYDCDEELLKELEEDEIDYSKRSCNAKTLDILSTSEEKVIKSIDVSKYTYKDTYTFSAIKKFGKKYFCLLQESMEYDYCLETYAYSNGIQLIYKGKIDDIKVNKDGNLCVLKGKTLTIYDENGKIISTQKNKKISDCK